MPTLLLRLAGPMQSWGTQSRFGERDTGLEPSKSGVIGLLCAALGRPRESEVSDLAELRMGVRANREGIVQRDYQTLGTTRRPDGKKTGTVLSNRYYLADADFLVGLEGTDIGLLEEIEAALAVPRWTIFLGRKSFLPSSPVRLSDPGGIRREHDLLTALFREPWRPRSNDRRRRLVETEEERLRLRTVIETDPALGTERRIDQPGPGAAFSHRRFLPRYVLTDFSPVGDGPDDIPMGEPEDV